MLRKQYRVYEVVTEGTTVTKVGSQYGIYTVCYEAQTVTITRGVGKDRTGTKVINNIQTKTVTVDKQWINGSENITGTIQNAAVTVELRVGDNRVTQDASGANIENVVLDGTVDSAEAMAWTYTWNNLPKYDSTGAEIEYTVVETSAKVETNTELLSDAQTATWDSDENKFRLTNTLPVVEHYAVKEWKDTAGNSITNPPESITFTLNATAGGTAFTEEEYATYGITTSQTVTAIQNWTADWSSLPKYTNAGALITYDVSETAVENYEQTRKVFDQETSTWTFTNTFTGISIKVTKQWTQGGENKTTATGISFELHQVLTAEGQDRVDEVYSAYGSSGTGTVSYDAANGWQIVTIPNLPLTVARTVGEGESAQMVTYNASYYVKETGAAAAAGYMLTTTYSADGGTTTSADETQVTVNTNNAQITIINTETAGVELPATGGSGTLIYTVAGMGLIVLAGMLLVSRKRKYNR